MCAENSQSMVWMLTFSDCLREVRRCWNMRERKVPREVQSALLSLSLQHLPFVCYCLAWHCHVKSSQQEAIVGNQANSTSLLITNKSIMVYLKTANTFSIPVHVFLSIGTSRTHSCRCFIWLAAMCKMPCNRQLVKNTSTSGLPFRRHIHLFT